jgi:uncharacterized membrane protein YedE/YeeE
MSAVISSFCCGLVFALGLGIGGMTQPAKVLGFLDVFGAWDPSLAFVMAGAVATHAVLRLVVLRRAAPVLEARFSLPTLTALDARLLAGAALFGVGWGIAGFCPGPAVVASGAGARNAIVFAVAMLAGMFVQARLPASAQRS